MEENVSGFMSAAQPASHATPLSRTLAERTRFAAKRTVWCSNGPRPRSWKRLRRSQAPGPRWPTLPARSRKRPRTGKSTIDCASDLLRDLSHSAREVQGHFVGGRRGSARWEPVGGCGQSQLRAEVGDRAVFKAGFFRIRHSTHSDPLDGMPDLQLDLGHRMWCHAGMTTAPSAMRPAQAAVGGRVVMRPSVDETIELTQGIS